MKQVITLSLLAFFATTAIAQVKVEDPWVRATVAQQKVTGAFLRITAERDARLVEVRSPVAQTVEIHEMKMEGDVMKMRPASAIDLPAGKPVALEPGGLHVMLIGLEGQVKEGHSVPLTLVVEGPDGKRENVEVEAPVRPLAQQHQRHGHGHEHEHGR